MKEKNSIKVIEHLVKSLNEGVIIYDLIKNKIILFNEISLKLLCIREYKKSDKVKALNIFIEHLLNFNLSKEQHIKEEVYCNLKKKTNKICIKLKPHDNYIFFLISDISISEEKELIVNELSSFLMNNPKIIAVIDKNGEIELANTKFIDVFQTATNIVGTNILTFGLKNKRFQNIKIWKTITEGSVWKGEIHTFNNKGEDLILLTSISPFKSSKIKDRFIIIAEDITAKKYYQILLKNAENKKDIILNSLPDTILVIDNKGHFTDYKSEKSDKLIHLDSIIGKKITEVNLPIELTKKILTTAKFCIKSKKLKQFLYEYKEKEKIYECRLIAPNDFEVICIIRDVTKRILGERILKDKEKSYKSMVESLPSGIIIHKNNKIVYANKTAMNYLGCNDLKKIRNKDIYCFIPEELREESRARVQKAMEGKNLDFKEFPIISLKNKNQILYETKPVLFEYYGEQVCQIVIRDLSVQKRLIKETIRAEMAEKMNEEMLKEVNQRKNTEQILKDSLKEKEELIKEIHHRVKNNMQIISSILNLQSHTINDNEIKLLFEESQNRIKSMALVHENIYDNKDFSSISFEKYVSSIIDNLLRSFNVNKKNILLTKNIENFYLPVSLSVPCGLIINEIISFSMKRFFVEISKENHIFVEAKFNNNEVQVIISDNGAPIETKNFLQESSILGIQLINALVDQINGKINFESKKETTFKIMFNIKN
ncbi:MAG: histidine kinase dimerization/phosphoacceptor domain -containing protein [Bacteroidales bacterium]|nr:histidine kinase dimerization/phosphoacceptor domain -containing protein [Bacteroidales bacterium]